jgi:hypothetical protein
MMIENSNNQTHVATQTYSRKESCKNKAYI